VFLIEIKSRPGRLTGDNASWTWIGEDGRRRVDDNPLRLANLKTKRLKDLLSRHLAAMGQEGATPEEYSGYFAEVAEGLEASFADMPTEQVLLAEGSKLRINMDMLLKLFLTELRMPFVFFASFKRSNNLACV
jgi:hypothetical protein